MGFIESIGRKTTSTLKTFLYTAGFFFQIIKESLLFLRRKQVGFSNLVMQILFTGIEAITLIAIISLAMGAVIIIEGISLLPQFGQGALIYKILIAVITREMGPILTAFIIIARSSTAIATELGSMSVSHELEAYVSVGINPISYLVVPRFLGVTISLLVLNLYFNIFGLGGSYFLTLLIQKIPIAEYFRNLLTYLRLEDILSSCIKSVVFGFIISSTATFNGIQVDHSPTEIPQVAIKAVTQGFIFCILANAVITLIYYI